MLSILFYFILNSVKHFITELQLLLIFSLILSTKQLYSCLSLYLTNQNLSFLIYPKQHHRRNAMHKTDPKEDCFMQVYELQAFFVHTTILCMLVYKRLALLSHLRVVTKQYILKTKCCKRSALKVMILK